MYDALRKYFKQALGHSLDMDDESIRETLALCHNMPIEGLVNALAVGEMFSAFQYDRSLFTGLSYCDDSANYEVIKGKLLPSIAFSVSEDEGAHWTLSDLHTYLVDGVSVGGHTIKECRIVENVKNAYSAISTMSSGFVPGLNVCRLHTLLMRDVLHDVNQLGKIRTRDVRLQGVPEWRPVPVEQLPTVFENESRYINSIDNTVERAVVAMLWVQYRQFFIDGNKRVARFMRNAILGSEHIGVFCIQRQHIQTYHQLLVDFYRTSNANEIIKYTLSHCLVYFPDNRTTHWPD